jgi:hypothetical protein
MLAIRLFAIGLLALGLTAAPAAQAANQLYKGSWFVDSFGNDNFGGTGESEFFSVFAMPQGVLCNPGQPRCPLASTPTSGMGKFDPLGTVCTPVSKFGAGTRPAKGATATSKGLPDPLEPRYRNAFFFDGSGNPKTTSCSATTTIGNAPASFAITTNDPLRGVVMKGKPVSGHVVVPTTIPGKGGQLSFPAAGTTAGALGMRRTTQGEFNAIFPYLYSYTYATLRNDAGFFSAGGGPGNFTIPYISGVTQVASMKVTKGANQFGGVMKMLGTLSTKVCYFRNGGCSLGGMDWRYEAIGATPYTSGGVVTAGYLAVANGGYYHTALMQGSTVMASGSRFPWTTGKATLTATGRGPHKTIHRRAGYDNRTGGGKGTIQLVSPVITRWIQSEPTFETGGVAVLRFEYVPEPGKWMMLVAGLSTLAVAYRARRR